MGAQRTSFDKRERDRAKKAKAAAKRERRQQKGSDLPEGPEEEIVPLVTVDDDAELSATELLERIEDIHKRFDAGTISDEDFEQEKADLLARLPID
ncbi:hypothetical protein BH20ACT2_BH20ACT2_21500 [soil metagenome]